MRRHGGGAGCGARARASQAQAREASGHRPPPLRGAALQGLDGTGRAGRKPRDRAGEEPAVRVPEARSRGPKSPRWSAGGARPAQRARAPQGVGLETAPFGAPPPHLSGARTEGAPGASKQSRARDSRVLKSPRAARTVSGTAACENRIAIHNVRGGKSALTLRANQRARVGVRCAMKELSMRPTALSALPCARPVAPATMPLRT